MKMLDQHGDAVTVKTDGRSIYLRVTDRYSGDREDGSTESTADLLPLDALTLARALIKHAEKALDA